MLVPRLLQMLFLTFILQSNSVKSLSKRRSECSTTCGNVTIHYPFGIEENCYLDPSYKISCNMTTGRVSISGMNVDIVDISLNGHLRALSNVGRVCYTNTSKEVMNEKSGTKLSRFPLSLGQNELTTFGCDIQSKIKSGKDVKATCATVFGECSHKPSCSRNINCCQIRIEHLVPTNFFFRLHSQQNNTGRAGFTRCAYAFIVESGRYDFSSFDVYNLTSERLGSHEMLLDWTVGNTSCEEAKKNISSYLCRENSECSDSNNAIGYSCNCSVGYQGNPYLQPGCQDVNECEDTHLHGCTHICHNSVGSYTCLCPDDHSGDGRKNGTGCKRNGTNIHKLGLYIGASVGVVLTSLAMFLSYFLLKQRRRAKKKERLFERNGGTIIEKLLSESKGSTEIVKIFTEEVLKKATNNFSPNNIIGQGGFGTVFKGNLIDDTMVAIKKSKVIDLNQIGQFVNEVVLLSQINHPNIVKLVGCCLETDVPLLAYEYVLNETLYHHLHGKSHGSSLTWSLRLNIAVETAGALAYMHSANKIIHRDIKSSNILLNDDYSVKISDFGISRLVPHDKTQVSTAVQGTLGYIDPEYFSSGILTEKSDVYSFGVLLVELLTGEKVNSSGVIKRNRSLVDHFLLSLNEDILFEILDDQVKHDGSPDEFTRVAELVKSCLRLVGKERPTMQEVKEELLDIQTNLGLACPTWDTSAASKVCEPSTPDRWLS
ncbi:hypothetical protein SSX86_011247 [Deinandra increscens subsp. villosa]|uniref:Protein kinase domain-containing protein n=1 Tax=Deinandra increscens subsp. villosa TaxID=3103831 RepID=A0AAP0H490_9ASTR